MPQARQGLGEPQPKGARLPASRIHPPHAAESYAIPYEVPGQTPRPQYPQVFLRKERSSLLANKHSEWAHRVPIACWGQLRWALPLSRNRWWANAKFRCRLWRGCAQSVADPNDSYIPGANRRRILRTERIMHSRPARFLMRPSNPTHRRRKPARSPWSARHPGNGDTPKIWEWPPKNRT